MYGIDLGQKRLKSAFIDPAGKPNIILNERSQSFTPTAIYFPQTGEALIGMDAIQQGYVDPSGFVKDFKLKLGTTENLLSNGQSLNPTEAAAKCLAYMKKLMEEQLNTQVNECVVTCPANFRDDGKQAILEAGKIAGLKILCLMYEPTAAGLAYALHKGGDKNYGVFDWGGGTFDVSIQSIKGGQITTLATEGIQQLGGNDLNKCLEQRVLDEIQSRLGAMPSRDQDQQFFLDLDQRVEAAKLSLNRQSKVPIVTWYHGEQFIVEISQAQFHHDIDPLIQKTIVSMQKALDAASLKVSNIDHLVMVGGTSRMPYIQEEVAKATGLSLKTDVDPDKAVAYGAAYAHVLELTKHGKKAQYRGQVIPSPDVFVQDVTAHAVGCCVVDTSGLNRRLTNAVIIPQNTAIPCRRSDQFFLEHEDQIEARIEILQGKPDAERDKCLLIGELALKSLPKEVKRTPRILVEYTIDANGMVTATATDKVSGQQQTVSVDYKKGVKPKDKPRAA